MEHPHRAITVYRLAFRLIGPLLPWYLRRRARRGKEDLARLGERYGQASRPRPCGTLVWFHGASVGESLSALPLMERLLEERPGLDILMTTGTVTSANLLETRLPDRAFHQYLPLDHPDFARAFMDHWQPDAVFWLESEFWPSLLGEVKARKVPAALLNARMSETSFRRWQKYPGFIRTLLDSFKVCLAQDEATAVKLRALNAPGVSVPGNLKYSAAPLPDEAREREALEAMIGTRPLVIAAQTVEGEELQVASFINHPKLTHANTLIIMAPRHPDRSKSIETALLAQGYNIAVRSRGETIEAQTQIYLADTMGELGLFFRLEAPVFLGRSLVPGFGGSNLLEPALFGRCVIQGPWTDNFAAVNEMFDTASASLRVDDIDALHSTLYDLLQSPSRARAYGAAAQEVCTQAARVLGPVAQVALGLLPPQHTQAGETHARP